MSDINEIQNIIIIDNKYVGNYTKMIDAFKPKDAAKCYISVSKFEATFDLPDDYGYPTHNLALFVSGAENTYSNDPISGIVLRSQLIDSFMSTHVVSVGTDKFAVYNIHNQTDNWIKVSMSDLNDFRLSFKTSSVIQDLINVVQFQSVSQFAFFLHLRVKFE